MGFLKAIGRIVNPVIKTVTKDPLTAATFIAAGPVAALAGSKIQTAVKSIVSPHRSADAVQAAQDAGVVQPGQVVTQPYFPQQGPSPVYYAQPTYYQPYASVGGMPSWESSISQPMPYQETGVGSWETFSERALTQYLSQPNW